MIGTGGDICLILVQKRYICPKLPKKVLYQSWSVVFLLQCGDLESMGMAELTAQAKPALPKHMILAYVVVLSIHEECIEPL